MDKSRPLRWLGLLLLVSCGGETRNPDAAATSEGATPLELVLELGSDAEDAHQQFHRISSAIRTNGGTVAVADSRNEIRFFGMDGQVRGIAGGSGEGPGEFGALMWLKPYRADSLIAWDPALARISVLDSKGRFGRSFRVPSDPRFPIVFFEDVFSDGSLLAMAGPPWLEETEAGSWATVNLLHVSEEGEILGVIGSFPRHPCGAEESGCVGDFKKFRSRWVAGRGHIYVSRPDRSEISVVARTGDRLDVLAGMEATGASDKEVPTYSGLFVDEAGAVWARPGDRSEWYALADGRPIFSIQVPEEFEVHQIGRDFVVGVARDGLGVETVRLYRVN